MGKGIASKYIPSKITICENCFHKVVCGDKDYLTEDTCCNLTNMEKITRLIALADSQTETAKENERLRTERDNLANERNFAYLLGYEDCRMGNKCDYKKLED